MGVLTASLTRPLELAKENGFVLGPSDRGDSGSSAARQSLAFSLGGDPVGEEEA
jgi:hypothetical protein